MIKKSLFTLIRAGVLGFAVFSCSSDKDDVLSQEFDNPVVYRLYTDYISDITDEAGVVYVDYFTSHIYIDGENGNRYYLLEESIRPDDGLTTIEKLRNAGLLTEGNRVSFSGKVYVPDERWIPGLKWRLDNYGWTESAKEHQIQLELPKEGHTFWLVAPYFTITKAE